MRSTIEGSVGSSMLRRSGARLAAAIPVALRYKIRHAWRLALHWLRFRDRVHDDRIVFPRLVVLHLDPADERARYVRRHRGITQPGVTGTWLSAHDLLAPDLCLDIGANYGEVSLLARYRDGRRLVLFEPNPTVLSHLRRSVAGHVDASGISVVPAAVGDAPGRATLALEDGYSGTSTLRTGEPPGNPAASGGVDVEVTTVDATLADEALAGSTLLFKIDVEGYEGHALAGMAVTLGRCGAFAGIVEYDREYLDEAGSADALATARRLLGMGNVWAIGEGSYRRLRAVDDFPDHVDVLVSSDAALGERLSPPWGLRSR